ncbi:hypothetical protein ACH5RR_032923 [Cinchona calisaya]|uniref:F-box protein n=1 Tax=Cinchona calisaya TaxID=153742 RepID=A0ABD2YKU8_9GENT
MSLRRGISWTDISFPYNMIVNMHNRSNSTGVLANGHLHWMANEEKYRGVDDIIVYFNQKTNKFNRLPTPKQCIYGLGNRDGCLVMCTDGKSGDDHKVLIMREYGVKESWTTMPVFVGEEFLITNIGSILAYNVTNKSSKRIKQQPNQEIQTGPLGYVVSLSSVY